MCACLCVTKIWSEKVPCGDSDISLYSDLVNSIVMPQMNGIMTEVNESMKQMIKEAHSAWTTITQECKFENPVFSDQFSYRNDAMDNGLKPSYTLNQLQSFNSDAERNTMDRFVTNTVIHCVHSCVIIHVQCRSFVRQRSVSQFIAHSRTYSQSHFSE